MRASKKIKEKNMRQEKFEMAMSNVWFLMFGLSLVSTVFFN